MRGQSECAEEYIEARHEKAMLSRMYRNSIETNKMKKSAAAVKSVTLAGCTKQPWGSRESPDLCKAPRTARVLPATALAAIERVATIAEEAIRQLAASTHEDRAVHDDLREGLLRDAAGEDGRAAQAQRTAGRRGRSARVLEPAVLEHQQPTGRHGRSPPVLEDHATPATERGWARVLEPSVLEDHAAPATERGWAQVLEDAELTTPSTLSPSSSRETSPTCAKNGDQVGLDAWYRRFIDKAQTSAAQGLSCKQSVSEEARSAPTSPASGVARPAEQLSVQQVLEQGSGVYCYVLPELQVYEVTAEDGGSLLSNEYVVLKVGKTEVYSGGFAKRMREELVDVRGWRHAERQTLGQRVVFLLSGPGESGYEKPVIHNIGANIGRAGVDRSRSAATLQRVLAADPSNTLDNIVFKKRGNLKVGHGWRLWLSHAGKSPRTGPSEFVVVHRDVVAALRREFYAAPGALCIETLMRLMREHRGPALRAVCVDFADPAVSLGPLHFDNFGC